MSEKKSVRVGIFSFDFVPWEGGMGRHVYELTQNFGERAGVQVLIFSPCRNTHPRHKAIFCISKKIGQNLLFSLLLNFFIKRIIRQNNLDIIHIHGGSGGILLLRKLCQKLIVTVHTNNYLCQYRKLKKISKRVLVPFEKYTYTLADKIIAVSSYIKNNLVADYRIPSDKIWIVANGVNRSVFFPIPFSKREPETLLYVGRIYPGKGLEYLIQALELVVARKIDFQLLVAGEGRHMKQIRRFLQGKRIKNHINFLGFLKNDALRRHYNQATLYVMPSVIEGFGLTLLEAMACGCPVVSTNSGGAVDVIRHNHNGMLVEYGDPRHLADCIVNLLQDEAKRGFYSRNGFETVTDRFNWAKIAAEHLEIYACQFFGFNPQSPVLVRLPNA